MCSNEENASLHKFNKAISGELIKDLFNKLDTGINSQCKCDELLKNRPLCPIHDKEEYDRVNNGANKKKQLMQPKKIVIAREGVLTDGTLTIDEAIWKPVPEFEGRYEVSIMGRIRTIQRKVNARWGYRFIKPKLLPVKLDSKKKYCLVDPHKDCARKTLLVHRIVGQVFIPNPLNKPAINHKNGNKLDNSATNLEWVTVKENIEHSISTGLVDSKGVKNAMSKLNEKQVTEIYKASGFQYEIAKRYNITQTTVSEIKTGKNWKHVTAFL